MASTVMMLMRTMVIARPVMMRWLLDLLTICHSWQKVGVVLGYKSSYVHRGRVSIGDFCDRGSVYTLRDVVRLLCIFFSFFYFYLMYSGLVTIWQKLYLSLDIYKLMHVIHLSFHVLFRFSLYAHASYILYAIF